MGETWTPASGERVRYKPSFVGGEGGVDQKDVFAGITIQVVENHQRTREFISIFFVLINTLNRYMTQFLLSAE
jgi:hypothetical protein